MRGRKTAMIAQLSEYYIMSSMRRHLHSLAVVGFPWDVPDHLLECGAFDRITSLDAAGRSPFVLDHTKISNFPATKAPNLRHLVANVPERFDSGPLMTTSIP